MKKTLLASALLLALTLVGCSKPADNPSQGGSKDPAASSKVSEECTHGEFVWKFDSATESHWKQCKSCKKDLTEKEACTKVRDPENDVAATSTKEGVEAWKCSVCGHQFKVTTPKTERKVTVVKEWTNAETVAAYSGTPKVDNATDGTKEIKFAKNDTITLTYTAAAAETVEIEINSAYKLENVEKQFFCDDNFTKDRYVITLNGETVAQDYNNLGEEGKSCSAADVGCNAEGTFSDGSSVISNYVWVEFADLALKAGENTIVITGNHGGYTPWIRNVRLVKAA